MEQSEIDQLIATFEAAVRQEMSTMLGDGIGLGDASRATDRAREALRQAATRG